MHIVLQLRASGAETLVCSMLESAALGAVVGIRPTDMAFEQSVSLLVDKGINVYVPDQALSRTRRLRHLNNSVKQFRPDVIFAHSVIPAAYIRFAQFFSGVPIVSVLHDGGEDDYRGFLLRSTERILRFRSCWIIAVSERGFAKYKKRFGSEISGSVIGNGIKVSKFKFSESARAATRALMGFDEKTKVFLQVGRIAKSKGQLETVKAFLELVTLESPKRCLLFAGINEDAEYRNEIDELIKSYPAADIRFLDSRKDVPELLSAADVYLMPSQFEATSIAILEALASGIPMVVSRIASFAFAAKFTYVFFMHSERAAEFSRVLLDAERAQRTERDLSDHTDLRCFSAYDELAKQIIARQLSLKATRSRNV